MKEQIKKHFRQVFNILVKSKKIIFPEKKHELKWRAIINEWAEDDSMTLFVRKGSMIRGTKLVHEERTITTTDNTPAHWIFKNMVLDRKTFSQKEIAVLIRENKFPISFIRKRSEHKTLFDGMVADKNTRLNVSGWKLAHIKRIAMKRGKNITIDDYKRHHLSFLDLSNMYLIDKDFSGLAEVKLFNDLVMEYRSKID